MKKPKPSIRNQGMTNLLRNFSVSVLRQASHGTMPMKKAATKREREQWFIVEDGFRSGRFAVHQGQADRCGGARASR